MSQSLVSFSWGQLLYLGLGFFLFYIFELLFFFYKYNRQEKKFKGGDAVAAQINALACEIEFLKVRVASLNSVQSTADVYAELADSILPPIQQDIAESPYAQAIRLAQQGADATEVAAVCGISRGEADLIVAIYRSAARS